MVMVPTNNSWGLADITYSISGTFTPREYFRVVGVGFSAEGTRTPVLVSPFLTVFVPLPINVRGSPFSF